MFTSGVPLIVAPLDATADLKLTPEHRVRIFTRGTPLTDALAALDYVWRHTNNWKGETPILFDLLPIAALYAPDIARFESLHVVVEADGLDAGDQGPARQRAGRGRIGRRERGGLHDRPARALSAREAASARAPRSQPNAREGAARPRRRNRTHCVARACRRRGG